MWSTLKSVLEPAREGAVISPLVRFISNHPAVTAVAACSTAAVFYGAWFLKRPKCLPPGPYGYPLMGCLPLFAKEDTFKTMADKYGDVFTLWMGGNCYLMILSSYEAIKEVYISSGTAFMDRDADTMTNLFGIDDTIFNAHYDESYKESRKITKQAIRTLINTRLCDIMTTEMREVASFIDANLGKEIDVSQNMQKLLTNTMTQILFNKRHNDKESDALTEKMWCWNECSGVAFFSTIIPSYLSNLLLSKPRNRGRQITRDIMAYIEEIVDQHHMLKEDEKIQDILDAYLKNKYEIKFTKRQIASTLFTFMPDATFTTPKVTKWMLLYLANHPAVQDNIYDEIQKVTGQEIRELSLRSQMPVTESFIMEVFRVVTPFAFGLPNRPLQPTVFRGYRLPDTVSIMPHYVPVHQDPSLFPEPEKFKADRFVKDGNIGNTQGFMPFGIGRRMCIGEQLVRSEIFYIVTSLIKMYRIYPPGGIPLSTECDKSSFVKSPKTFTLRFEKR